MFHPHCVRGLFIRISFSFQIHAFCYLKATYVHWIYADGTLNGYWSANANRNGILIICFIFAKRKYLSECADIVPYLTCHLRLFLTIAFYRLDFFIIIKTIL